jgi:hypothetical protein
MSVMGGESVAWEFARIEQEAFPAAMVARDQQTSISGMFFGRSHGSVMTALSTCMSFDIEGPAINVGWIRKPKRSDEEAVESFGVPT